ncbi:uncharacterized protein LOC118413012 [Branchiostoma floridae]|uniref:Uncharacterized protein LOC118413012 n=1 Tax=Branchiostoma floridae TaxID=7739 RepID=A0A9J7MM05_BRAFL|nr:uncharacterized protein LOC118413012 [Branchiostoma floridae]
MGGPDMRTMELALLLLLAATARTAAEGDIKVSIDKELANIEELEEDVHKYGRRGFTGGGLSGGGFSGSGEGSKYISLGCWKDTGNRAIATLEGTDARLDGSYPARKNAIEKCYQVAKSRGFSVFAVQNGGWCAGSATALSTYRKYGPSSGCGKDGEGGGWANEVYLITGK